MSVASVPHTTNIVGDGLAVSQPRRLSAGLTLRDGVPGDGVAIAALVGSWAEGGLTIPRSVSEIEACVADFVLVERDGEVLACGAAHETCSGCAVEIRSVAVREHASGLGAGRLVVEGLVRRSIERGVSQSVLLTKIPAFFARCGFEAVAVDDLPSCYVDGVLRATGRDLQGRTAMRSVFARS